MHKDLEKRRKYQREYYRKHNQMPEVKEKINRRREAINKLWLQILKEHYGEIRCLFCGYNKCFAALEFHHINHMNKKLTLSTLFHKKATPERIEIFKKEIVKCILLCANCHKEIHYKEKREGLFCFQNKRR